MGYKQAPLSPNDKSESWTGMQNTPTALYTPTCYMWEISSSPWWHKSVCWSCTPLQHTGCSTLPQTHWVTEVIQVHSHKQYVSWPHDLGAPFTTKPSWTRINNKAQWFNAWGGVIWLWACYGARFLQHAGHLRNSNPFPNMTLTIIRRSSKKLSYQQK